MSIITSEIVDMKPLPSDLKNQMVGMHLAKKRNVDISQTLGCPVTTVQSVLAKFKAEGSVEGKKPSGRPSLLNDRDLRHLERDVKKTRRAPMREIVQGSATKASATTIRLALKSLGYNSRVAIVKPYLSAKHKAARLEFAKHYAAWTVDDWKRVIWTDESTFEIGKPYRKVRVWRKVAEKYDASCLAPSFKSGRSSVMVWGGFIPGHKLKLVIMEPGRRNSENFIEQVYEKSLGPFLHDYSNNNDLILMEDGAPVHRSQLSSKWREKEGIVKLKWPAQSPDLNPIENLWSIMKSEISTKHPIKNLDSMKANVLEAWESVPTEKLEHLAASMPERIQAVITAKGGSTPW